MGHHEQVIRMNSLALHLQIPQPDQVRSYLDLPVHLSISQSRKARGFWLMAHCHRSEVNWQFCRKATARSSPSSKLPGSAHLSPVSPHRVGLTLSRDHKLAANPDPGLTRPHHALGCTVLCWFYCVWLCFWLNYLTISNWKTPQKNLAFCLLLKTTRSRPRGNSQLEWSQSRPLR